MPEHIVDLIDESRISLSIGNKIAWFKEAIHHYLWCSKRLKEGYKFVIYNDDDAYEYNLVDFGNGYWVNNGRKNT